MKCGLQLFWTSRCKGQGKGSLLLEKKKKEEDNLNGWVVDHENDSKQEGSHMITLVVLRQNGFSVCNGIRIENEKYQM
jgi:hypothetical protein